MTCFFFSSFKTLLTLTEGNSSRQSQCPDYFLIGRFSGDHHWPVLGDRRGFWSLLKRNLSGTYVCVEPFHLFRYLDEQAFRYNNRKNMDDSDRFSALVSQVVGKRLTYAELTGKTGQESEETRF
jgi:hypothetical protein